MEIKNILAGDYSGFENRICKFDSVIDKTHKAENIITHFLYLPFLNHWPTEDEFIDAIYDQIVPFCIPNSIRKKRREEFEKSPKKEHLITGLRDQAQRLFQKAKSSRKKSGEVGELILFMLQEFFLSAPQIACKMSMKTSAEMPVHGSDGIHVLKKENGEICFLWGESKIYQNPKNAVKRLVESINKFNEIGKDGQNPKQRDIEILNDYPNISDPHIEEKLLKYFNIYEPEYNLRKEAYSCFIGFDFTEFNNLREIKADENSEHFQTAYDKKIEEIYLAFLDEIKDTNIVNSEFYFFILPFSSVKELRRKFFLKLGIVDIDLEDED